MSKFKKIFSRSDKDDSISSFNSDDDYESLKRKGYYSDKVVDQAPELDSSQFDTYLDVHDEHLETIKFLLNQSATELTFLLCLSFSYTYPNSENGTLMVSSSLTTPIDTNQDRIPTIIHELEVKYKEYFNEDEIEKTFYNSIYIRFAKRYILDRGYEGLFIESDITKLLGLLSLITYILIKGENIDEEDRVIVNKLIGYTFSIRKHNIMRYEG